MDAGDTLAITASTLPSWLSLTDNGDGTASLTGTPTNTDVGDHSVVLEVSDGDETVSQSFTVTVTNTNDAPTFTSTAVTAATEDSVYSYAITTDDVDAGDTLAITAATLPSWLSLTDNGDGTASLTGTPTNTDVGDHSVVLEVSDGDRDGQPELHGDGDEHQRRADVHLDGSDGRDRGQCVQLCDHDR